jgi:hypothetical protein
MSTGVILSQTRLGQGVRDAALSTTLSIDLNSFKLDLQSFLLRIKFVRGHIP